MMFKRLTSIILVICLLLSYVPAFAEEQSYDDISKHWAENEIKKWSNEGLLLGSNGKFRPNDYLTRAEMAVIVDRLMNYTIKAENSFVDLSDDWYTDAILKNNKAGIILGSNNYVRPNDYITRQEAVVIFSRALGINEAEGDTSFPDDNNMESWSKGYIKAFSDKGYIDGMPDGTFAPNNNITRASVVKIIDNIIGKWIAEKGVVSQTINGTVIINTQDVTLKDTVITGDLILAAGVGEGEIILENTEITGQLIVNGGGENSVKLKGKTKVDGIEIKKEGNGVRIVADKGITVPEIRVKGESKVIIDGEADFSKINIKGAKTIEIREGTTIKELVVEAGTVVIDNTGLVEIITVDKRADSITLQGNGETQNLSVNSNEANIAVGEDAFVSNVTVNSTDVTLENTGTIDNVTVNEKAKGTKIEGTGVVADVEVKADNVEIETQGTNVTVGDEVEGVTAGDKELEPGETAKTEGEATTGDKSLVEPETSTPSIVYIPPSDTTVPVITIDETKAASIIASQIDTEPDWTTYFIVNDNKDGQITVTNDMITEDVNMLIGGVYTVTLIVSDKAGNESTESINFTVQEVIEMLGSGTVENPYLVSSIEDLCTIGKGIGFSSFSGDNNNYSTSSHYKLIRDLDFNNPSSYQNPNDNTKDWDEDGSIETKIIVDLTPNDSVTPTNVGFAPIGYYGYAQGEQVNTDKDSDPFYGTFDGNGKIISNLYINRGNDDVPGRKGLFSYTTYNAVIKNIGLVNIDITGYGRVGGLVGSNSGSIDNCYVTGIASGIYNIGGLVGVNDGEINKSYASVTVIGEEYIGGFVGTNEGTVSAIYATGDVKGYDYVGGLIGENYGTLTNSYATGDVLGTYEDSVVGGLVGNFDGNSIDNCIAFNNYISGGMNYTNRIAGYIDSEVTNTNYAYSNMLVYGSKTTKTDINNGVSIGTEELINISFLENDTNFSQTWDFSSVWEIKNGAVRPTLIGVGNDDSQQMKTSTTDYAEAPTISINETQVNILEGETLDLSVTSSVQDGGTLSYEWYRRYEDNTDFEQLSETQPSLTETNLTAGVFYYLIRVTNTKDGVYKRESSEIIEVTVSSISDAQIPQIVTDLDNSSPVTYNVNTTSNDLVVSATVSDGGTLSYQWYKVIGGIGTAISGEANQAYTPPTDTEGIFQYYCQVTNTNNSVNGQTVVVKNSNTATIIVEDLVHAETPTISMDIVGGDGQPEWTYSLNDMPEGLVLEMNPVLDGGSLSFEWFVAQQPDLSDAQSIGEGMPSFPAEGSVQYPNTMSLGTYYYYCDITNTNNSVNGNKTKTVRSAVVTVNVNEPVNNAPTVGFGTPSGVATPQSNDGQIVAVPYKLINIGMCFIDDDNDPLNYIIVSAKDENNNDVSGDINISPDSEPANGDTLTYTPSQLQAGKNVTIIVKANDGIEDSTENVIITVSVGEIPNSKPTTNQSSYSETAYLDVDQLYTLDVSTFFTDLDNDTLTYIIDEENVNGTVEITGSALKVTPIVADSTKFPPGLEIQVKVNDGTEDSDNVTIYLNVKEDLTSVDTLQSINIARGTLENEITFPSQVYIYHGMMGMSTVPLSGSWTSVDYDNSQFGSYTFTQNFTLPDNVSNLTNIPLVATVTVNVNQMLGDGQSEDTAFEIQTVEDMCLVGRGAVAGDSNDYSLIAHYKLINDLDFTLDNSYADPNGPDTLNIDSNASTTILKDALTTKGPGNKGFLPIACGGSTFKGAFDGGGYTIKNLYINIPGDLSIGLFSYTNSATIKNLGLDNVDIASGESVGGLIGRSEISTISGCYTTGKVLATGNDVGGLIGYSSANTISNSYSTATVNGGNNVGGLVGYNKSNSTRDGIIQDSYATGSVTGTDNIGGLVGFNSRLIDSGVTGVIRRSYSKSNVSGNNYVGGLVGRSDYGEIDQSYAIGQVSGASYVGGLVGQMNNGHVYNTYATGSVIGTGNQVGGLVGSIPNGYGGVTFSYATGNVTGANQVGGLIGYRQFIYDSQILNNIAFNESISGVTAMRFLTGEIGTPDMVTNNYANSDMLVNGSPILDGAIDNENGGDLTTDQFKSSTFLTDQSNWYSDTKWNFSTIWEIKTGAVRPTLKGVGDDDGSVLRN